MATLGKQHDRYFLQFYHRDRHPKQKRIALKTSVKRDAEAFRSKLERDYLLGTFDPWQDDPFTYDRDIRDDKESVHLKQACNRFIDQKRKDGRGENTLDNYRWIIMGFAARVGADVALDDLKESDLHAYVHDASIAKTTQHTRFRHMRVFLRWCQKVEIMKVNLLANVIAPDKPQKLPKAMTEEELDRICNSLQADYEDKLRDGRCREGEMIWYISAWKFAYYTGLRASELGRLRWKHIDFQKRLIFILKQKNKKEQTVPLNRKAAEILKEVPEGQPDDYVFKPYRSNIALRKIRPFVADMGRVFKHAKTLASIQRKLTPHSLRHSFCTRIAEAGKSALLIKEAARHADISTSMIYVHLTNDSSLDYEEAIPAVRPGTSW